MTSELADVAIERMDRVVVATVSGEIDMSNAARVRQRIAGFVTPEDWAVVLDHGQVIARFERTDTNDCRQTVGKDIL